MFGVTTKEKGHIHAVYVSQEAGQGVVSPGPKDGHNHQVIFDAEYSQQWIVQPSEDGHTHFVQDLPTKSEKEEKKTDSEIIAEVHALYSEAKQLESTSIKNGKDSYDMYMNRQWDETVKREAEALGKATVTVNELRAKIDLLVGYNNQNRTDVSFKPKEDSDAIDADLANILTKHVFENNGYVFEESKVFKDQVIPGRGIFNVSVDYDTNIEGIIRIEHFDWDGVYFGPHKKEDQADLEYLVKHEMFSKAKLEQLFPEKAKELKNALAMFEIGDDDGSTHRMVGEQYTLESRSKVMLGTDMLIDLKRKEFKVLELWRKVYKIVPVLVFSQEEFTQSGRDVPNNIVDLIAKIPGAAVVKQKVHEMEVIKIGGSVLLSREFPELPENSNDFDLITTYAVKHGDEFQGKVEPIKDVQRIINKIYSQIINVSNRMSAYGWFVDAETFHSDTDMENFKADSATAGFVAKIKDLSRPPQKVEGVKFPTELANTLAIASAKLHEIIGIPPEAAGFGGNQASGKAILLKRRQSLLSNDFLFDSLSASKRRLAKMVIAYIQDIFSVERVKRIIRSRYKPAEGEEEQPNVVNASDEDIQAFLKNKDLTRFDITTSESEHTETMRDYAHMAIGELMQTTGAHPVLLESFISTSSFPNRGKMLSAMQQQNKSSADADKQKAETEMIKSAPEEVQRAYFSKMMGGGEQAPQLEQDRGS